MLVAYVTGQLPETDRQVVEAHLAGCVECRVALAQWREVQDYVRRARPAPPAGHRAQVWDRVLAQLSDDQATTVSSNSHDPGASDALDALSLAIRQPLIPIQEEMMMEFVDTPPSVITEGERPRTTTRQRWFTSKRSYPVVAAVLLAAMVATLVFFVRFGQQSAPISGPNGFVSSACGPSPISMHLPWGASFGSPQMVSPTEGWLGGGISDPRNTDNTKPVTPLLMHFHQCQWTRVNISLPGFGIGKIEMLSPTEGFAEADYGADAFPTHTRSYLLHYHDGVWQKMSIPVETHTMGYYYEVWHMISADEGWIAGQYIPNSNAQSQSYVLREQHGKWSVVSPQSLFAATTSRLTGTVTVDSDTWGYGYPIDTIEHYVNGEWQPAKLPAGVITPGFSIESVDMLSPQDIWALGGTANNDGTNPHSVLLHYDGTTWSLVPVSGVPQGQWGVFGLIALSAREVWLFYGPTTYSGTVGLTPPLPTTRTLHYKDGIWRPGQNLPDTQVFGNFPQAFNGEAWGVALVGVTKKEARPTSDLRPVQAIIHLYNGKWDVYDPHTQELPPY